MLYLKGMLFDFFSWKCSSQLAFSWTSESCFAPSLSLKGFGIFHMGFIPFQEDKQFL